MFAKTSSDHDAKNLLLVSTSYGKHSTVFSALSFNVDKVLYTLGLEFGVI